MNKNKRIVAACITAIICLLPVITSQKVLAGSLKAWGQGEVPNGNNFTAIKAGGQHNLALKSDGSIVA